MKPPKLVNNAGKVARKSWAFRLSLVAAVFSGVEMALPLFSDTMPRNAFLLASILVALGSAVARLVAQPEMHDEAR